MNAFKNHNLKIYPEYFDKIISGEKTAEIRFNDRGFKIMDGLTLKEWCPKNKKYTGKKSPKYVITDITQLDQITGLKDAKDWVVLHLGGVCS